MQDSATKPRDPTSEPLVRFDVRRVDMNYVASLDRPAFELPANWVRFQSALYSQFSKFQLSLKDIKVETSGRDPDDFAVACWILNSGAVVRYRLDRIEAWSNRLRLDRDAPSILEVV